MPSSGSSSPTGVTMKMEAQQSFETFVTLQQSTQRNISEDLNLENICHRVYSDILVCS